MNRIEDQLAKYALNLIQLGYARTVTQLFFAKSALRISTREGYSVLIKF